jgi:flagellar L-ring protein FlgH
MRFVVIFPILFLVACAGSPGQPPRQEWPQAEDWQMHVPPQVSNSHGSLYNDSYMFALFQDNRAYRVGDILTVELDERTQSSKSADSNLDQNTNINLGVPNAGNANVSDLSLAIRSRQQFDGESSASQQNFLRGSITVRVLDVMPNGVLAISGEKWIRLNQGDEYIQLSGLVRAEDIDLRNRVSSQRIADARINYSGKGLGADASKPGWFTDLFVRYLNPF